MVIFNILGTTPFSDDNYSVHDLSNDISVADNVKAPFDQSNQESSNEKTLFYPRLVRTNASLFLLPIQLNPSYVLQIEFLPEDLSAKHFIQPLAPPNNDPWFVHSALSNGSGRLSGWKDANLLYKSSITYHS